MLIKSLNKLRILGILYRPFSNIQPFLQSLEAILDLLKSYKVAFVIGDINIYLIPKTNDSDVDDYLNLLTSHEMLCAHMLLPLLDSCLDHVMLCAPNQGTTLVLNSLITDHAPIIVSYSLKVALR